jgi:hypothetical protein
MDSNRLFSCVVLVMVFGTSGVMAQTHFTFTANTGGNAVVAIPLAANPNIAGVPLSAGDEIGAFSPAGLCVGACVWDAVHNQSISVWADNPITPAIDGMVGGQVISYRIWSALASVEYPIVLVSYSLGDGTFAVDGFYIVSSLSATGDLPVELSSFTVTAGVKSANLSWTTATEVNNYGFEVERTASGRTQWQKIGFVEGAGTTNAPRAYSYSDRDISVGTWSYRLKQIDRDGKFIYSRTVEAAPALAPDEYELSQNYPNPFNPATTIGFDLKNDGYARMIVYNVLGEHVADLVNVELAAGHHSVVFDASQLPGGIYFYRLDAGTFLQVKKMTLLK